jgi:PHD/YefM family antitoxin component YafN of YafNO toxin-antitoxin module
LIERVAADAEPIVVATDAGQRVVVLPLNGFTSWRETWYLFTNPADAAHPRRSIAEFEEGAAGGPRATR